MTIVVLLFLAGIWGVVLYGYFRDRLAETRPADSIGSFRRQLSVLQRTGPHVVAGPAQVTMTRAAAPVAAAAAAAVAVPRPAAVRRRGPSRAQRRRRDIVFGLLIRNRNIVAEREMKLRFLPSPTMSPTSATRTPEPALLLRRTGN